MDVLSDALNVVRLAGAVFFTATFSSRCAITSPDREDLARFLHLPSHCISLFHILTAGRGWIRFEGSKPIPIEAGDVVVFPHGTAHEMGSDLDTIPQAISTIFPTLPDEKIPQIKIGAGSPKAHFICGYLHCDQQFNPLLESLPKLLVIRANQAQPSATDSLPESNVVYVQSGEWLEMTRRYIIEEANREQQGHSAMLVRLTEVLFVEIVRRYMQQLPSAQRGWLAGVRDPIIGHTLRLLHTQPEYEWTVDELAQAVGLARSTLAQRFREIMGESPMRYLAGWRMQVAQHLLRQTSLSMIEVAEQTGYESEAAFSRAFKRYSGQPPAMWRTESRVRRQMMYIWELPDGQIVTMAGKTRPISQVISISLVYTPPAYRGRGYASNCVAALSQHLLGEGWKKCSLVTDLANPMSNSIYQKIGYRPVCDFIVYTFEADDQPA